MPPALDRLLASPSALRLLRLIVEGPELSPCRLHATKCCDLTDTRRYYSIDRPKPARRQWPRWGKTPEAVVGQEKTPQLIHGNDQYPALDTRLKAVEQGTATETHRRRDTSQWAADLASCERFHGQHGIKTSWISCRSLNHSLPIEDTPDAEFLWGTYIKVSTLVPEVIDHAFELLRDNGQTFPRLYELVMNYWLPRDALAALDYNDLILEKLKLKSIPLKALVRRLRSQLSPAAYKTLMVIYRKSHKRNIYDEIVPHLIDKGDMDMARRWHNLCVLRNDMPSEAVSSRRAVQIFTAEYARIHAQLSSLNADETLKQSKEDRKYNRALLRRLSGRDSAPVRFEDSFCARMFATQTFPPDSIIRGLAMVGVNEIGPQAVQAMASRTEPLEELAKRFHELRANGITLQGCVFSLALEKFALQEKWHLVRSLLDSDQHPDVYDNAEIQRKLLNFYLEEDDQTQILRTLAILTLFHNDSSQESWNLLLQTYIKGVKTQDIAEVLQNMRSREVMVTSESITALRGMLRPRHIGRRPDRKAATKFDDVRFVAKMFIAILESGIGFISPLYWREIIRRFGMSGRFRELRRLLLWLLCWYVPRCGPHFPKVPEPPFLKAATQRLRAAYPQRHHYFHFPSTVDQHADKQHPIRELFPPPLHNAIIIWGFRAGLLPNAPLEQSFLGPILGKKHYRKKLKERQALKRVKWSAGLETIVQLRDFGVYVHRHTVIKALQQQFVVLFGHGRSNQKENRAMEQANTISYAQYVREVNHIWGSNLFREPQSFYKGMIHDHMWHPRMRRRVNRKTSVDLREILGSKLHNFIQSTHDVKPRSNSDSSVIDELKDRFEAQSKGLDPGFTFLDEPLLESAAPTPPATGDIQGVSKEELKE